MKGLLFERNVARFAASRLASVVGGSGRGAAVSPLRLTDLEPPELPGPDWVRVRPLLAGICGSDLSTLDGRSSRYFEDVVSFPFVPGHEVVGQVEGTGAGAGAGDDEDGGGEDGGERVVVEPALGCVARGIVPLCPACAEGRTGGCERVAFGHLAPGLQIGYCADTGGGWSAGGLVAHRSQLHPVPGDLSDEAAVMVEPTACAVHAVLDAEIDPGMTVAVLGAGTLGLCVVAALTALAAPGAVLVGARYRHQRALAQELGADAALEPEQLARAVRRRSGSLEFSGTLTGGADVVVDCVGSEDSLAQCLTMVRPRGRVVLVGMPGRVRLDLASLWHREVAVTGAYAYGTEHVGGTVRRTFDVAMEVVARADLGRLVSAAYPLERFEEALAHAGAAGRRGAVKVVFDLRPPTKGRPR
ncbi:MAG TPA: zinc-binding dehydrogenase [Acidimicrobiales bacterium]|nr:zinc-binding dehydrogenase [Acidimicrobiales bacterium]